MDISRNKTQYRFIWCMLIIFALINIFKIYDDFIQSANTVTSFAITEFLINYSAGYIRRGLVGEILHQFTNATGLDPRWIIIPLCISAYIATITLVLYLCKIRKCCPWITILVFFSPYATMGILRKDYIIFLFAAAIIYFCCSPSTNNLLRKGLALLLYILAINVHECIFFMITPFLFLYFLHENGKFNFSKKSIISTSLLIIPMALISMYKGDSNQAQIIHDSWLNFFGAEFGHSPSGTIQSLSWTTKEAIDTHLEINFLLNHPAFLHQIARILCMPLLIISTLYITCNIVALKWGKDEISKDKKLIFTSILFLELISLSPMLTVVSCDISRIITYWLITSILIYTLIPNNTILNILPDFYKAIVNKLNALLFHKYSSILATAMLLFLGFPWLGYRMTTTIQSSPVYCYYQAVKDFIHLLG